MDSKAPFLVVNAIRIRLPKIAARKFSTRFGHSHWVILTALGDGSWNLEVWGPKPAHFTMDGLTESEAKERALDLVAHHINEETLKLNPVSWNTVCLRSA